MESFSNKGKFDMIACYVLCQRNCVEAGRMYLNRNPEIRQPHIRTFSKLVENLKTCCSFKRPVTCRKKPCNEEKVNSVLLAVTEIPETSVQQIGETTRTTKSTAHFFLQKNKFRPFKFRICQGLRPGDSFCEWYTRKCQKQDNFPYKVIWSDKSMVILNRRNGHYWSRTNLRLNKTARHQHRFGFSMWAAIFGTRIIGPFFYHHSLTSERYRHLLENDLQAVLDLLPLAEIPDSWFQQDGAPAHNSKAVREYLMDTFAEKGIGTYLVVAWPARSPDINPLDYFLWGYIKNYVYKFEIQTEDQLQRLVLEAFASITPAMLANVLDSSIRRCYLCLENDGSLFEHLL